MLDKFIQERLSSSHIVALQVLLLTTESLCEVLNVSDMSGVIPKVSLSISSSSVCIHDSKDVSV